MNYTKILNNLLIYLNKNYNIQFKYKNESTFMKLLGYIVFFNPKFMKEYTTTIGNTIYLPNKNIIEAKSDIYITIILHEFQHVKDSKKIHPIIYSLMYLFPQLLSLLIIPFAFIIGWWSLLFLLFLLPLPAPFRSNIELSGYKVNLITLMVMLKKHGHSLQEIKKDLLNYVNFINTQFKSSSYYFMKPRGVKEELIAFMEKNINYSDIYEVKEIDRDIKQLIDKFLIKS